MEKKYVFIVNNKNHLVGTISAAIFEDTCCLKKKLIKKRKQKIYVIKIFIFRNNRTQSKNKNKILKEKLFIYPF